MNNNNLTNNELHSILSSIIDQLTALSHRINTLESQLHNLRN